MDGKARQPTTSATNRLQPQHTHHWSCMPHHTHLSTRTIVHTHHGWVVVEERLDDHTVMTNTPLFHDNHSLHQHHCGAQHPHQTHHSCRLLGGALAMSMPLCTTSGLESVVLCMPCVVIPLLSLLSTPLPFSLTLCVIGSHSVSNTFTSERLTVPTHTSVKKETVWMAHCKQGTLADAHINPLRFKKGFVAVCVFVMMNDTHGMKWRINGDH